jgi:hypothetical protein
MFANNFQKSGCCNRCRESTELVSEHKRKAWPKSPPRLHYVIQYRSDQQSCKSHIYL